MPFVMRFTDVDSTVEQPLKKNMETKVNKNYNHFCKTIAKVILNRINKKQKMMKKKMKKINELNEREKSFILVDIVQMCEQLVDHTNASKVKFQRL